jgi:hypothetical protein
MRNAAFHKSMARLALVAMLLLAALPTVGRLAQPAADGMRAGLEAMCTSAGLRLVDPMAVLHADHHAGGGAPDTPAHPHEGPDCAYCPLLASLAVALACLAVALCDGLPRALAAARRASPQRSRWHPCGLGSRGPPLFS